MVAFIFVYVRVRLVGECRSGVFNNVATLIFIFARAWPRSRRTLGASTLESGAQDVGSPERPAKEAAVSVDRCRADRGRKHAVAEVVTMPESTGSAQMASPPCVGHVLFYHKVHGGQEESSIGQSIGG